MDVPPSLPNIFTLEEAEALLPTIKHLTAEAVRRSETIGTLLRDLPEEAPEHAELAESLQAVVHEWAESVRALGIEVKGLWLVDFDNGEGYYCWRYPEERVSYYHGYDEGFAGRVKIH